MRPLDNKIQAFHCNVVCVWENNMEWVLIARYEWLLSSCQPETRSVNRMHSDPNRPTVTMEEVTRVQGTGEQGVEVSRCRDELDRIRVKAKDAKDETDARIPF